MYILLFFPAEGPHPMVDGIFETLDGAKRRAQEIRNLEFGINFPLVWEVSPIVGCWHACDRFAIQQQSWLEVQADEDPR